jgi:hypothetical protein
MPGRERGQSMRRLDQPSRRIWLATFALVTAIGGAWALATPIFAAPDEPAHVIRAVAAAHGQLRGREFGPHTRNVPPYPVPVDKKPWLTHTIVDVPAAYRNWGNIKCLVFNLNPVATASCLRLEGSNHDAPALTHYGRYPPGYYLTVGSLSYIIPAGRAQVYAMRMFTVLLGAALIASAAVSLLLAMPGSLTLLALAVALTPMVFFMLGTVNANAIEIAAGVGVWASGAALATGDIERLGPRVIDRLGIASVILVLARPDSAVLFVLILAVLALATGRQTLGRLAHEARARVWAGVIVGAGVLQLAWFAYAGTLDTNRVFPEIPTPGSRSEILRAVVGHEFDWLRHMIGWFGWVDAPAPTGTIVLWVVALGAILGLALLGSSRRLLSAIGLAIALCMLVPAVMEARLAHVAGYYWQGRYLLPFAVGVPILCALAFARHRIERAPTRRIVLTIGIGLALAEFLAFAQQLRRYSVDPHGTIWFFTAARWNPPVPSLLLLVWVAASLGIGLRLIVTQAAPDAEVAATTSS